MDDLVQFLRDRLDEDERLAADAQAELDGRWTYVETRGGDHKVVDSLGYTVTSHYDSDAQPYFCEPHIARHDPARVLAEVEAKRQMLDLHEPGEMEYVDGDVCMACDVRGGEPFYPCKTLRLLALPYADHPDYREAWRP